MKPADDLTLLLTGYRAQVRRAKLRSELIVKSPRDMERFLDSVEAELRKLGSDKLPLSVGRLDLLLDEERQKRDK